MTEHMQQERQQIQVSPVDRYTEVQRTYHTGAKLLAELVAAIDAKWTTTTPPKQLLVPLQKAKEYLET